MTEPLQLTRIRYPLRLCTAQVVAIHPRSEHRVRITFRSPELKGFASASFDDHVKVLFPRPGETAPRMPTLDAAGKPVFADKEKPIARDYTPRRFDAERGELVIEFALHRQGPASLWAARARIGQTLGFAGPRGSRPTPDTLDWYWLIGDETAVPAIDRRLESLPATAEVTVILLQQQAEERLDMPAHGRLVCHRLAGVDHDKPEAPLQRLLAELPLPPGEGFIWIAGELSTVRASRQQLIARGIDKRRIRASSYWQHGCADSHETLED